MSETWLYLLQRATAWLLAALLIVHLVLIVYAVEGGLTAAEILGRTRGSAFWAIFYGALVVAASIHAPIGLRPVLREWTSLSGRTIDWSMAALALLLAGVGARGVVAVTL